MSCRVCGLRIKKGERFVLVGFYPSWWKNANYQGILERLDYFGDLYHEACYLELFEKQESKQKQGVRP